MHLYITCKIDNVLVNYLYILIVLFWELFVHCFVRSAQTADRRVCWRKFGIHLSFWEKNLLTHLYFFLTAWKSNLKLQIFVCKNNNKHLESWTVSNLVRSVSLKEKCSRLSDVNSTAKRYVHKFC